MEKSCIRIFVLLGLLSATNCLAEPGFEGLWGGTARAPGEETRIELDITQTQKGWQARMNLLDIAVRGWPAESVTVDASSLTVVVRADSGPQTLSLRYKGWPHDGELAGA
ncbi:MAG: hypothetical protein ACI87W_002410 [Halieaceae bacterium]|jgi:hypothetical protein